VTRRLLAALAMAGAAIAADSSPTVRLPPHTRQSHANGVVLLLAPLAGVPMMTAQLTIRGGSESDPSGMAGLAALTAELLRSGTSKRSADQISQEFDSIGATLTTTASREAIFIRSDFLSRDTDKLIELFSDLYAHPAFPEQEFNKTLARRIDEARAAKDEMQLALASYFPSFFFPPQHPYARPMNGDELSLTKIKREDVVAYHKRMFVGKNLIVAVSGDFDSKALTSRLGKLPFLPGGQGFQGAKEIAPVKFEGSRLALIDKPDATQTYFSISQPGIERTNPDRVPMMLVNTLFGERFTSMLNEELRVNTGLTYGARSQVDRDRLTGAIAINTYTKSDSTVEAIDLALEVLKRLSEKGISEEQLASSKAYVKGLYPTQRLETDTQIATLLTELELFGLNAGEVDDLFSAIDAVTLPKANEVARRYYRSDNLQFLLIGNATAIREKVSKYAQKMKVIPGKDPGFVVPEF
jgi:zinc protease